jgi:hypothetical protein
MIRKILLTLGALLIAAALVCLAVVAVGIGRFMLMPEANAGIEQFRRLQTWGYGGVASVLLAFILLWFVRDRQPAERKL